MSEKIKELIEQEIEGRPGRLRYRRYLIPGVCCCLGCGRRASGRGCSPARQWYRQNLLEAYCDSNPDADECRVYDN
jgi:hypothetical protein